jgi:uncharacterized protein YndB with AHSA1/START domain
MVNKSLTPALTESRSGGNGRCRPLPKCVGCYLEVIENEKLVWTVALAPGFRPSKVASEVPAFTAVITMEPHGKGTKYSALAMHGDEADAKKHAEMGFHDGWGKALDQLVAHAKT